jgi:hypothetical protein
MLRATKWTIGVLTLFCLAASVMAQEKGTGYLKVKAQPGRAGVFVDGKYLGPASNFRITRTYVVPVGDHELSLRDPRHQDYTTKITIQAGKTNVVSYTLPPTPLAKPPFGVLKIAAGSKYDAVYVNGKFMGHVDEFDGPNEGLLLNPGEYEVKVVPASAAPPHEEKIKIETNRTTVVRVK